jgi:hypothetical protein
LSVSGIALNPSTLMNYSGLKAGVVHLNNENNLTIKKGIIK